MNDIVERLLDSDILRYWQGDLDGAPADIIQFVNDAHAAAAEIQSLREQLKERDEAWRLISEPPTTPQPVVFFAADALFFSFPDGRGLNDPLTHVPDHKRAEACDLGYWDGSGWFYSCTNHAVFELPDDHEDRNKPTHWMPLPAAPSTETPHEQ